MRKESLRAILVKYAYDSLGRLTQTQEGPTGTPIETYAYDATDNRTALTTAAGTASYTYPADSHRLIGVDGEVRNHDAAGNTVSIGGREFVYNAANRMGAVNQGWGGAGKRWLLQGGQSSALLSEMPNAIPLTRIKGLKREPGEEVYLVRSASDGGNGVFCAYVNASGILVLYNVMGACGMLERRVLVVSLGRKPERVYGGCSGAM